VREYQTSGFTLLELAIVLVVIALVTAGILVGSDLIRGAELRKVHKELETYISAVGTFRAKYNCLPGDCEHATDFFAQTPQTCFVNSGDDAPIDFPQQKTACDGNGNGMLDVMLDGSGDYLATYSEGYGVWQQLADADLIPGVYSGSASSTRGWAYAAYNCPALITEGHCPIWLDGDLYKPVLVGGGVNVHRLGATMAVFSTNHDYFTSWHDASMPVAGYQIFSPSEVLSYDMKFDDGVPDSGQVVVAGSLLAPGCTSGAGPYRYDSSTSARNCMPFVGSGY
jgi:prepilin-type N-terminal cleavage/methylation domain-containing protein